MPPENGRHWTNPTKVIWGLIGLAGFLLWGVIQANGSGVTSNEKRVTKVETHVPAIQANEEEIESNGKRIHDLETLVPVMQEQYKGIERQLTRIVDKLDGR